MKKTGFTFEKRKTRKGFTLIELLVVMAILGLLAVVGLASFRSSQIKGRDAQRKHDLDQMQRALEAHYNDKGEYPDTLPAGPWQDPDVVGGALYMREVPTDPRGFTYFYESNNISYKIFAYLENENDFVLDHEMACVVGLNEDCSAPAPDVCNYGVSSANLRICDPFE